jgi:hypothetical protein
MRAHQEDFNSWWESLSSEEREEYLEEEERLELMFEPIDEEFERIAMLLDREEKLEMWSSYEG